MTQEIVPILVLGTCAKAGSRHSGLLNLTTEKHPTGVATIRSGDSSLIRLGAVNPLIAP
jgi:hypothetical protein